MREFHPGSLRIWHWLNAAVISGLLLTVLLRKTFLSWRTNSEIISSKLDSAGLVITPELAKDIAVTIRNPLWDWHIYLGYTLGVLFVLRLLIAFFSKKESLFSVVLNSFKTKAILKPECRHYYLVKLTYVLFYIMTLMMLLTGIVLIFKENMGLDKSLSSIVKEVHEVAMWFFVAFILTHVAGVIYTEVKEEPGLVSDMISGGPKESK